MLSTVSNLGNAFTGLTIGTTALAAGFKGLQNVTQGSVGQLLLGAQNAEKYSGAIGKLADANSKALRTFSALSDISFAATQLGTLTKGIQDAASAYARIPQTLQLAQASGVTTRSIEEFNLMTDAIRGNSIALDEFAISAVARLGQFEEAAARAGTILRSSTRFDQFGGAERANAAEQTANAFEVQGLVNSSLRNTISSTDALLAQYEILSSGFVKAADSQAVLEATTKLQGIGQAGGVIADPVATSRLVTKTLNAYELGAGEAAKTGAILNAVVEYGLTSVPELSENFGQAGQSARAAGVSLVDLGASTSVLTTQGINTAQALTGLQRLFANIISKSPDAEKALSKLSLNGQRIRFDVNEIQTKGFTQALVDLNKAASGNAAILQQVLPEDLAFRTALALLTQDGQKLASVSKSIGATTAASLDKVFEIATGDRVNRLAQIANRFQELVIKTAQSIAPVFEPGLGALEGIASAFNNLPEPVKQALGQFIAFQITTKASASAVGILFKTMLDLGGAYLQVRLISLLLSGQLGKEAAVVGQLVTQRKGLIAAGLQVIGIDQRWRLGTEATTQALTRQSVAQKALGQARNAVGNAARNVVAGNIQGFQQQINGAVGAAGDQAQRAAANQTLQNLKQSAQRVAGEVGRSAKNIGLGVAEAVGVVPTPQLLGADGRAVSQGGLARIKAEAQKAGEAAASAFRSGRAKAEEAFSRIKTGGAEAVSTIRADPQGAAVSAAQKSGEALSRVGEAGKEAYQNIKVGAEQAASAIAGNTEILSKEAEILKTHESLIAKDSEVRRTAAAAGEAQNKQLQLEQSLINKNQVAQSAALKVEQQAAALTEARAEALDSYNSVSLTQEERSQKIAGAIAQENTLKQSQIELDSAVADQQKVQQQVQEARVDAEKASSAALQTSIATEQRLLPVAEALTEARVASTVATQAESVALVANREAAALEAAAAGSPQAIQARAAARSLDAQAINLRTIATERAAAAEALYATSARASELAELGLAEARIFGRTVTFSTSGPLGALNTLLATNVTVTTASAAASTAAARASGVFSGVLGGLGKLLSGTVTGVVGLGRAAGEAAAGGLSAIVGSIGLLAPILGVATLGIFALRDQFFGLGGASRDLAKSLKEVRSEGAELDKQFGKDNRLLDFKTQVTAFQDSLKNAPQSQVVNVPPQNAANLIRADAGLFDRIASLPDQAVGTVGQVLAKPFDALGKQVNQFINRDLINVDAPTAKLEPLRATLDQLRTSGDLTSGQFADLATALNTVGESGTVNADKLDAFKQKLDAIRQGGTGTPEKGVGDVIGGFFTGIPGFIGNRFDATLNEATAKVLSIGSLIQGKGLTSGLGVAGQRQADSLVQPLSEMGIALEDVGRRSLVTSEQVQQYNKALFLSAELNDKFAQGGKLTAEDFDKEAQAFKQQEQLNSARISGYEKTIEKQRKVADAIKDPELKRSFENQINLLEVERQKLEKSNELLKQRYEEQVKYYKETLPALQRAVTESSDPAKALADTKTSFTEQFIRDAEGKLTPFIKDIGTLRSEAQRYQEQLLEAYETGAFDSSAKITGAPPNSPGFAEEEAARRLREVRDNKITLPDGTKGFRSSLAERKAATQQIVELENAASSAQQTNNNLGIERTKAALAARVISAEDAETKIQNLQINSNKEQLKQKEALIAEYKKQGFRTVGLEQEAANLRVQIQQQEAEQVNTIYNRRLERRKQQLANEALSLSLAIQKQVSASNIQTKDIELDSQITQSTSSLRDTQSQFDESALQDQLKFTSDVEARAAVESALAKQKLRSLPLIQASERESLKNQNRLNELSLQREASQTRLAQIENDRNIATTRLELAKAQRDKAPVEEVKALQLQLQSLEQQSGVLDKQAGQVERQKAQQQEITRNSEKELGLRQGIARQNTESDVQLSRIKENQAAIEKLVQAQVQKNELLTKQYDQQKQLLEAQSSLTKSRFDSIGGELQLAADTTTNEQQKKELALSIAGVKVRSLQQQLVMEKQVLELNLLQQSAQLEIEKSRNNAALATNLADISTAGAKISTLDATPGATPEQKKAAQLELEAKLNEGVALKIGERSLQQQELINKALGQAQRQELRDKGQLSVGQAKLDYAQNLTGREKAEAFREINAGALSGAFNLSPDAVRENPGALKEMIRAFGDQTKAALFPGSNLLSSKADSPLVADLASPLNSQLQPNTLAIPKFEPLDYEKFRQDAIARLKEFALTPQSIGAQIPPLTGAGATENTVSSPPPFSLRPTPSSLRQDDPGPLTILEIGQSQLDILKTINQTIEQWMRSSLGMQAESRAFTPPPSAIAPPARKVKVEQPSQVSSSLDSVVATKVSQLSALSADLERVKAEMMKLAKGANSSPVNQFTVEQITGQLPPAGAPFGVDVSAQQQQMRDMLSVKYSQLSSLSIELERVKAQVFQQKSPRDSTLISSLVTQNLVQGDSLSARSPKSGIVERDLNLLRVEQTTASIDLQHIKAEIARNGALLRSPSVSGVKPAQLKTAVSTPAAEKPVQLLGDIKPEITIHVHLDSAEDRQLGQQIESATLTALADVFQNVKRKL